MVNKNDLYYKIQYNIKTQHVPAVLMQKLFFKCSAVTKESTLNTL